MHILNAIKDYVGLLQQQLYLLLQDPRLVLDICYFSIDKNVSLLLSLSQSIWKSFGYLQSLYVIIGSLVLSMHTVVFVLRKHSCMQKKKKRCVYRGKRRGRGSERISSTMDSELPSHNFRYMLQPLINLSCLIQTVKSIKFLN